MLLSALLLTLSAVQPAFLAGGAPRRMRLVIDEAETPPASPNYSGWSKSRLLEEYTRLDQQRPGIGGPIALISSGGGASAASLLLFALASAAISVSGGSISFPAALIFALVGGGWHCDDRDRDHPAGSQHAGAQASERADGGCSASDR